MNFLNFFSTFVLLDPDPEYGSGSTDPIESDPIQIRIRNPGQSTTQRKLEESVLLYFCSMENSVVDPHHVDADPDSTYHPNADPDADPDSDFFI
jgi:hypothetical protein